MAVKQALILASGLGTRMKPITDHIAKPMVMVNGNSLIGHIIDHLYNYGIRKIVITCFYKAELLQDHVKDYATRYPALEIVFVVEDELHEVWGSIYKSLNFLDNKPFFLVNGDSYWINKEHNLLASIEEKWQQMSMNAILMLSPIKNTLGYDGNGDFALGPNQEILYQNINQRPYVYIGIQIIDPHFISNISLKKDTIFGIYKGLSYNLVYGTIYDGYWFHIGTPQSIEEAEEYIKLHKLNAF